MHHTGVKVRIDGPLPSVEEWGLLSLESLGTVPSALPEVAGDRCRPEDRREPAPDCLARWLAAVIELQEAAADSLEFYERAALALVELIGLDLGLVLLRREASWLIAGNAVVASNVPVHFSRALVDCVAAQRQTFFRDFSHLQCGSLSGVEAAVAAPIFGLHDEVAGVLYGVRAIRGGTPRREIQPLEAQLVQLLAGAVAAHRARTVALRTRSQFEQFFSPELVRELERDPKLLEGRQEEVTVLFCDLRGYTSLSEQLGAETTCRLLRDVMERLSESIATSGGVIVDYAGDGILAMWNAPLRQPDHVTRAVQAARTMLAELPGLNARWADVIPAALEVGIGINTGAARVGNTGSRRKLKYGPHGHTVNVASRIQDVSKQLGVPLVVTSATREQLPGWFPTRRLGQFRIPGVQEPVTLYEAHGEHPTPGWLSRRDCYEQALSLYEAGEWPLACQTMMPLLASAAMPGQHDVPTLKLMRSVWNCLETPPASFEPIVALNGK